MDARSWRKMMEENNRESAEAWNSWITPIKQGQGADLEAAVLACARFLDEEAAAADGAAAVQPEAE